MSRAKILAAVAGLVVVGGVVAAVLISSAGPDVEVAVAQAERRDLAVTVIASGRVESGVRRDVFPASAGVLAEVQVVDGQEVVAGQTLAVLDSAPLDLSIAQAEAALAAARAQAAGVVEQAPTAGEIEAARLARSMAKDAYDSSLSQEDSVRAPSQAELDAAANIVNTAQTTYDMANSTYLTALETVESTDTPPPGSETTLLVAQIARDQAYASLLEAQSTQASLLSFDEAAALAAAASGATQAKSTYAAADAQYQRLATLDLSTQRMAAQTGVDQAQSALDLARSVREAATLTAPIDGIVLFNALGVPAADGAIPRPAEGVAVNPAAPPFTVVDFGALTFVGAVDEADVDRIEVAFPAVVYLDAFADEEFSSAVSRIAPAAQLTITGGTVFPVSLELVGTTRDILIGMRGDATIEIAVVKDVVVVPIEALFDETDGTFVYVVEDGRLRREEVVVGTLTETDVEIVSGVVSGETVALSGTAEFVDDLSVAVP
ncbi:MAG: biotin/lipoyl-binding protein [Actinomycetota bacterium]|nr:biotin/lipoyl-binding protein [Actinomycetota bacterium]